MNRANTPALLQTTRAEIEKTRIQLSASMGLLRQEMKSALPWHVWAQRSPLGLVVLAAAVGFVFGIQRPKRLHSGGTHANACTED